MLYLLFRYHHVKPAEAKAMGHGERIICSAFMKRQIEEMKEEMREYVKSFL